MQGQGAASRLGADDLSLVDHDVGHRWREHQRVLHRGTDAVLLVGGQLQRLLERGDVGHGGVMEG